MQEAGRTFRLEAPPFSLSRVALTSLTQVSLARRGLGSSEAAFLAMEEKFLLDMGLLLDEDGKPIVKDD